MEQVDGLPSGWLAELEECVGPDGVVTDPREREWAAEDAAGRYRLADLAARARPVLAVVRPDGTEAVAAVVRWAARRGVALVPRGAGTGVMGGAVPLRPAVVVDLGRLDDVAVHPEDLLAEAGAGALLADVDAALRRHGLMLGHDPWSVAIATVGGAIGTDGVGYMAGRWGSMGDQVAAVEAVLPDGTVVRTRPVKPVAGPDLRALFVGSQGTFGIVTRAWLRAVPVPERQRFAAFRFRGFEEGFRALLALWRTGLRYDLLDFGDGPPEWYDLPPGLEDADGRTAVLYLGAFGPEEESKARLAVARRVLAAAGARELGPEPAEAYWRDRHAIAERYAREVQAPRDARGRREGQAGFDYLNLALPPSRVIPYRRRALERVRRERGFRAGETGIWCRPEIFSLVVAEDGAAGGRRRAGPRSGADPERMRRLMEDLMRLAIAEGGNAECIHGPGIKLLPLLAEDLGPGLGVIRRLKACLDPAGVLNPGKWGEGEDG